MDDDRILRIGVILAGHVIWLSAGALRIIRGSRGHELRGNGPWWIEYYPPLVWLPLLAVLVARPFPIDLDPALRYAGLALTSFAALFAASAMWSLGRGYGIRTDIFEGHALKTDGPYALVRHPMYLGIVVFHIGASVALASTVLLAATTLLVVPYTALRLVAEEQVLRRAFGSAFDVYTRAVPAILPGRPLQRAEVDGQ